MNDSKFTGKMLGLIGVRIASFFITLLTLGIGFPWAIAYKQRWITKHQIVDGQRLIFKGTGAQLFGNYFKWVLLSIVTFGIYALWLPIKIQQWITKHTHVRTEEDDILEEKHIEESHEGIVHQFDPKKLKTSRILWIIFGATTLILRLYFELSILIRFMYLPILIPLLLTIALVVLITLYISKPESKSVLIALVCVAFIKAFQVDTTALMIIDRHLSTMSILNLNFGSNQTLIIVFSVLSNILVFGNLTLLILAIVFSFTAKSKKQ